MYKKTAVNVRGRQASHAVTELVHDSEILQNRESTLQNSLKIGDIDKTSILLANEKFISKFST